MNILKIGENIYKLRKEKKITQEELSKIVGVSTAAVSKWEGGASYPDITLLPIIADFFEVSIDELMSYEYNVSDTEIEEIGFELMEDIDNDMESGMTKLGKYIRKYSKSYKLKSYLAAIIFMKAANIKDEDERKKKYAKALAILEDVINNANDDIIIEQAFTMIGNIYQALEDYDLAIATYKKIKKGSGILPVDQVLGNLYIKKGDIKQGRILIQRSILSNIGFLDMGFASLGLSYKNEDMEIANKYMELRRGFLDSVEKEMNITDYQYSLELFCETEKEDEAAEALKKLISDINDNKSFSYAYDIPWYASEIEVKKKDVKTFERFNLKKMLINGLLMEKKYESLLKREDIKVLLENMK